MKRPPISQDVIREFLPEVAEMPTSDQLIMSYYALGYEATQIGFFTTTRTGEVKTIIKRHDPSGSMMLAEEVKCAICMRQCDGLVFQLLVKVASQMEELKTAGESLNIAEKIVGIKERLAAYRPPPSKKPSVGGALKGLRK